MTPIGWLVAEWDAPSGTWIAEDTAAWLHRGDAETERDLLAAAMGGTWALAALTVDKGTIVGPDARTALRALRAGRAVTACP